MTKKGRRQKWPKHLNGKDAIQNWRNLKLHAENGPKKTIINLSGKFLWARSESPTRMGVVNRVGITWSDHISHVCRWTHWTTLIQWLVCEKWWVVVGKPNVPKCAFVYRQPSIHANAMRDKIRAHKIIIVYAPPLASQFSSSTLFIFHVCIWSFYLRIKCESNWD